MLDNRIRGNELDEMDMQREYLGGGGCGGGFGGGGLGGGGLQEEQGVRVIRGVSG